MIIIGIVGSPAGGKSTVAKILSELGATWINADLIARSVLEESEVQERLLDQFGDSIQGSDLKIDRTKLAAAVFG
ncbi:MAG: dephospho-CoA kinase, partial [Rubripirellula sp.]